MLGQAPYYNQTLRRVVIVFGALFKNLQMISYDANTRAELSRITVPIKFEGKENFISRDLTDPTLHKGIQITLPQMSYEIKNLQYDPSRKISSFLNNKLCTATNSIATPVPLGIPYRLFLDLNLYIRNMEDGLQIVEQIIPFFAPSYTVNMNYIGNGTCTISNDVPFTLLASNYSNDFIGESTTVRYLNWTLNFVAEILLYNSSSANTGLVLDSIVNFFDLNSNGEIATISVTPNPNTANAATVNSYSTVITEFNP